MKNWGVQFKGGTNEWQHWKMYKTQRRMLQGLKDLRKLCIEGFKFRPVHINEQD